MVLKKNKLTNALATRKESYPGDSPAWSGQSCPSRGVA